MSAIIEMDHLEDVCGLIEGNSTTDKLRSQNRKLPSSVEYSSAAQLSVHLRLMGVVDAIWGSTSALWWTRHRLIGGRDTEVRLISVTSGIWNLGQSGISLNESRNKITILL